MNSIRTRTILRLALAALLCLGTARTAAAGGRSPIAADVAAVAGLKRMDSRDWRAFERQREAGVKLTIAPRDARFAVALDGLESSARRSTDQYSVYVATRELATGVRYRFDHGRFRGIVGAGPSVLGTEFASKYGEHTTWRRRGVGVGGWCSAGLQVSAGRALVGIDARRSIGNARAGGVSVSAGGWHLGMSVGFRMGRKS